MTIAWRVSLTALVLAIPGLGAARAQGVSESTGVNQYFTNSARCHESTETHEAPRTSVLKQMTPEHIFDVLMTGSMKTIAGNLSEADKRTIAEWVGGRKIDTNAAGSLASGGPTVANGMVFIGSGYRGFQGGDPGNVLLAFGTSVRLDVYADEVKKRTGRGGGWK
jgi:cytochrome c553